MNDHNDDFSNTGFKFMASYQVYLNIGLDNGLSSKHLSKPMLIYSLISTLGLARHL